MRRGTNGQASGASAHQILEAAFDGIEALVCVVDADGVILAVNAAWRRLAREQGAPEEGSVGQRYLDLVEAAAGDRGEEVSASVAIVEAVLWGGAPRASAEMPCVLPGLEQWHEVVVTRIERPELQGAVITHFDVTGRLRSEERWREGERFLNTLLQNLPGCVYRCQLTPEWPMAYLSDGVVELTGYRPEVFLERQKRWGDLIHAEDRERAWQEVQRAVKERRAFEVTYRFHHASGEVRWLWERGRGVGGASGAPAWLEGFISDVTESVRLEEQLRESRKMEAVGRLAGGIAHDFNNLLTVILGSSRLVESTLEPGHPGAVELQLIEQAASRAAELTRQLLAFARKQRIQPRVVEPNALVRDLEMMLERVLGEAVELSLDLDPGVARIRVDPAQLEQVILNLVVNARHAMPEGGRLLVETRDVVLGAPPPGSDLPPGRYVRLLVRDTGHGMSEDTLSHVFEPFFTTRESGEGTGLGLASSYGIVKQAGGHISVRSQPEAGTSFEVYLPAVEEAPAAPPSAAPPSPAAAERTAHGETLLLVEDDPLVMKVAQLSLRPRGYRLLTATSGSEALEIARSHAGRIHLVITDLVMPGMSGRELAEHLERVRPGVPILFVSGFTEGAADVATLSRSGAAFLAKPFTPASLAQKVLELLGAPEPPSSAEG